MITQVEMILKSSEDSFTPEWAYRLYAGCLAEVSADYAEKLHENAVTPISQFLRKENGKILWTVNLLGEEAEKQIGPVIMEKQTYHIPQEMSVTERKVSSIEDMDTLFALGTASSGHEIKFVTAAAFKSRGQYINLLTLPVFLKSLVRKWNGCFPEAFIEDEDGEGIDALASGLFCPQYRLRAQKFTLKGTCIYGFCGDLILKNNLKGFQRELADALLFFSQYSGTGIKTALGMGGITHRFISDGR